ncbi:hypothetical protein EYF80_018828 [Liparis tanakae]|uniref:Uncharacterized protein n=1 Tax=Liparis tanakae TaxID=230148 RepID=A0A4Z2I187_9TELE|nr:hypothetical protein EYF80_018828 [Liparis tanakae]
MVRSGHLKVPSMCKKPKENSFMHTGKVLRGPGGQPFPSFQCPALTPITALSQSQLHFTMHSTSEHHLRNTIKARCQPVGRRAVLQLTDMQPSAPRWL